MNDTKKNSLCTCIFFFFYILLLFLGCSKFSPIYDFNYWADINIYFNMGKGIWFDKVIYKDLFDHKGPIIFFIYSIGYLFSETNFLGIFIVQIIFQYIALYFSYLSIRLFVNRNLSIILSLLTPLFLLVFSQDGGSAEEFIYTFQLISFYFLLKYLKSGIVLHPSKYMLVHGVCVAATLFIKLNLIIFWFFPLLIIFTALIYNKLFRCFFENALNFLIGVLIILIPLLLYFYFNNALSDLWLAYFEFNFLYGALHISSIKDFILGIIVFIARTIFSNYVVFTLIISGILFFMFSPILKLKQRKLIIFSSALSLMVIIVSTRVLLPYYLISFTVFSVLTCIMIGILVEKLLLKSKLIKMYFFILSFLVCIGLGLYQKNFYGYTLKSLYNRDFPQNEVAIFQPEIEKVEGATLLICGFKKGLPIYTKMNILPNVKYFFFPNIHHEEFPTIRDEQTKYIFNKKTDFVILYENFRYYDYYKDVIELNYSVESTYRDGVGGTSYLYKKL